MPLAAGNTAATGFFSPRLGCRVFPPFGYGIDLAALCLEDEQGGREPARFPVSVNRQPASRPRISLTHRT